MKYSVHYELTAEAKNLKELKQKLSLIDMQMKIRDADYKKVIFDEEGWYVSNITQPDAKLNTREF